MTSATKPDSPVAAEPTKTWLAREWCYRDAAVPKLDRQDRGEGLVLACRFDPSGRFLFAGTQEHVVQRWELATGVRTAFPGHDSWVGAVAFAPDGAWLATADYVGRILMWPGADGDPKPRTAFDAHRGSIRSLAVSPDGRVIASGGNDKVVRTWSADGRRVHEMGPHDSHVYSVAFHPDGRGLVSADLKGTVKHWDAATGKLVRTLKAGELWAFDPKYMHDVGGVRGLAFDRDGTLLACAGESALVDALKGGQPTVVVIDWKTGEVRQTMIPAEAASALAYGARVHPDGWVVAAGGSRTTGGLWFWRPDAARSFHFHRFKTPGPGYDLDLHPDGLQVAVAHWDATVRVYSMTPEPPKAAPPASKPGPKPKGS